MSVTTVWTKSSGKAYTPLVPNQGSNNSLSPDSIGSFIKYLGGGTISDLSTLGYETGRNIRSKVDPSAVANTQDPLAKTWKTLESAVAPGGKPSLQGIAGEAGRDTAGGLSWTPFTFSPLGAGGVASTLGNWAATGAARGTLGGISQQEDPTGIVKSAATMAAIEPIARILSGGLTRTGGKQIGKAIEGAQGSDYPVTDSETGQSVYNKIKSDALDGINPADKPAATDRINTIVNDLKESVKNSDNPTQAMQDVKTSMGYTDYAPGENYKKIVDTNIRRILGSQISNLAPSISSANQLYGLGKGIQGVEQGMGQRIPYLAERMALLYPGYYLIRQLLNKMK